MYFWSASFLQTVSFSLRRLKLPPKGAFHTRSTRIQQLAWLGACPARSISLPRCGYFIHWFLAKGVGPFRATTNSLRALCDLGPEFQDLWPLLHSHELEKEKVTADRLTETGIYITHRPPGRASAEKEDNQESYCRTIDWKESKDDDLNVIRWIVVPSMVY
jgi:hypothetical protein